jgi:hypothetical protein
VYAHLKPSLYSSLFRNSLQIFHSFVALVTLLATTGAVATDFTLVCAKKKHDARQISHLFHAVGCFTFAFGCDDGITEHDCAAVCVSDPWSQCPVVLGVVYALCIGVEGDMCVSLCGRVFPLFGHCSLPGFQLFGVGAMDTVSSPYLTDPMPSKPSRVCRNSTTVVNVLCVACAACCS